MTTKPAQWRIEFDAEVEFSNGGALQAQGFRLDIPCDDIGDDELAELFVRHLGLLMVGTTRITRKLLIQEPHKGGRAVATQDGPRQVIELSGPGSAALDVLPESLAGTVDLPGIVINVLGSGAATVGRGELVAHEVAARAVVLHSGGGPALSSEAARWLVNEKAALLVTDTNPEPEAARVLRDAGVPVVTGALNLASLPTEGFQLHAVPWNSPEGPRARVYVVIGGQVAPMD